MTPATPRQVVLVRLAWIGALAAAYLLTARLGLSLGVAEQVTVIWPPTGIALAVLLLRGPELWPGIWIGALIANLTASEPIATAAGIATGNTLEALAAVWLLRRVGFSNSVERLRDVLALVLCAGALATTVAATIGVTSLCLGGVQPWPRFGTLWAVWWLGDAIGALLFAPLLLSWHGWRRIRWSRARILECLLLLAGLVVTTWLVFTQPSAPHLHPYAYVVFPFVIWSALRFDQGGTSLVVVAASITAIWGTVDSRGSIGSVETSASLFYLQGYMGVVATTGLMLGAAIRERNRVEDERAQSLAREKEARARAEALASDLREQQEAKDRFLAMLGHELRNPLAPVTNVIEILRQRGGASDLQDLYGMMQRQVRHMARLVDDLLDVSRIARGTITVHRRLVDVGGLVAKTVKANRSVLDQRQHRLTLSLPEAPLWLEGDATRLEQIVSNLLSNAASYTPPGGEIEVTLERVEGCAVLRVRDNGIGIRPESLRKIFEAFHQAERIEGTVHQGLGLGLTLVKTLAELHGGTVEAESRGPGLGSEFRVRLPLPADAGARAASEGSGKARGQPVALTAETARSVLVVDDNVDAARSLALLLELAGHAAEVAYDGDQALEKFRSLHPEIVLVDIELPKGMNGHELGRRLIQEAGARRPVLVAVTGYGTPADLARSREAGFDHHLTKPVDAGQLARILELEMSREGRSP